MSQNNPFFAASTQPFGLPPFADVAPQHFRPAFERAMAEHRDEVAAITRERADPDFPNTVAALERSGTALRRVEATFWNLVATDSNEDLRAIERDVSPRLAAHHTAIYLDAALFARIDALQANVESLPVTAEEARVLQVLHRDFVRAGARLDPGGKSRIAAIAERLAMLGAAFSQNLLADEAGYALSLEAEDDFAGLPASVRAATAQAAKDRGHDGRHVVTLGRSSAEAFLQFSARRDLRENLHQAWTRRGENGGETDNRAVITEIVALRTERAGLLGFATYADFKLDDTMAKTPAAVRELLARVWAPARERAVREHRALQSIAEREGANHEIAAADWRYYAEKQRKLEFDLDDAEVKPYFRLENMIEAAFDTATRLFGLEFTEQFGLPLYHREVRAFDVRDADGRHLALFLGDYFARAAKRSGAWMSGFRGQHKLDGDVRPIVVNVLNFSKPVVGQPCLLSLDEARTLFHEFGHALHGMLSDVTYPLIAGTNVASDFVELPSQLYEHWLMQPEVLRRFARHYETDEPMPENLIERLGKGRHFNQGFATVEFCASAIVDLELHLAAPEQARDVVTFERETLARLPMPDAIGMRHRTPHFAHIFSSDGYAAGYYSYLWSEVLDADAFNGFEETGDPFDPALAKRLHDHIYAAGNREEPDTAYRRFRGRLPEVEPLLVKRGLA